MRSAGGQTTVAGVRVVTMRNMAHASIEVIPLTLARLGKGFLTNVQVSFDSNTSDVIIGKKYITIVF